MGEPNNGKGPWGERVHLEKKKTTEEEGKEEGNHKGRGERKK